MHHVPIHLAVELLSTWEGTICVSSQAIHCGYSWTTENRNVLGGDSTARLFSQLQVLLFYMQKQRRNIKIHQAWNLTCNLLMKNRGWTPLLHFPPQVILDISDLSKVRQTTLNPILTWLCLTQLGWILKPDWISFEMQCKVGLEVRLIAQMFKDLAMWSDGFLA